MIPFEALIPWGIIFTFYTFIGGSVSTIRYYKNGYKRDRWNIDKWEDQLIDRDFRLTGEFRAQSDKPIAPEAFKVSAWRKLQMNQKDW